MVLDEPLIVSPCERNTGKPGYTFYADSIKIISCTHKNNEIKGGKTNGH
jgi:hypothetical protein